MRGSRVLLTAAVLVGVGACTSGPSSPEVPESSLSLVSTTAVASTTTSMVATTTTSSVPPCEAFAEFIFDNLFDSMFDGVFVASLISDMANSAITPDEAGDELFERSLDYAELVAVLQAMGDPPPEMVGAVFRMSKGLTQKSEALADMSRAIRDLGFHFQELDAARTVADEAGVIIQSAEPTACPTWSLESHLDS